MNDPLEQPFVDFVEGLSPLDGRFADLRCVSRRGHFSLVFEARDLERNRAVALKFVRPRVILNPDERYRLDSFDREADLLWGLRDQPDIISSCCERSVLQFPLSAGGFTVPMHVPYYAMERGRWSVQDVIVREAWGVERTLLGFRAMCRGVQRIHSHGIVHRDLKPDNFMVFSGNDVKLADFGTARDLAHSPLLVPYDIPPGDLGYTAPEILALLHDASPELAIRADMFALGAVLFELFTGSQLGLHLFTPLYRMDLVRHMRAVLPGERRRTYDALIPSIAAAHPVPLISDFGSPVPKSIAQRIDNLCSSLVRLDYRLRQTDFKAVFHELERGLFIFRNQEAYARLKAMQRLRQERRAARHEAVARKWGTP